MKHLYTLIKPASSLCNLRCRYCFYADVSENRSIKSYGIMSQDTMERMIDNVFSDLTPGDQVTFAFQGGEPTLAGLDWMEHFTAYTKEKNPGVTCHYALQTNGILLDENWCQFLKEHRFLVGLSLDGPREIHDRNRVDEKGQGTFSKVRGTMLLLERYGVEYNILSVLTEESARHPQQIWNFILNNKIKYIQFIPCLEELEGGQQPWALTPKRFYSFYTTLFRLWHKEVERGNYISVKLFDDIANLFVYGEPTACGIHGQCGLHHVVEADGGVYPCDFYVLDEYRLGNLAQESPSQLLPKAQALGFPGYRWPLTETCHTCPYLRYCRGGCPRMHSAMYLQGNFCGWKALLDEILSPLCADAQKLGSQ